MTNNWTPEQETRPALPPSGSQFVLESTAEESHGDRGDGTSWTRYSVVASGHTFNAFKTDIHNLVKANIGRSATIKYSLHEQYGPQIQSLDLVSNDCKQTSGAVIQSVDTGTTPDGRQYWIAITDKGKFGTLDASMGAKILDLRGRSVEITHRQPKSGGQEIVDLTVEAAEATPPY